MCVDLSNRNIISIFLFIIVVSLVFESIFVDKFCVFLIFVILFFLGRRERALFNPYFLFLGTPFSLLIYFNISDKYMLDLSHRTYFLAIFNMILFICSFMLTKDSKIVLSRVYFFNNFNILKINIFVFLGLSLLGFWIDSLSSFLWLFSIIAFVSAIKTRQIFYIIVILIFIIYVSTFGISKMQVLLYFLTFIISLDKYYNLRKHKIFNKILIVLGFVLVIFSFSFTNKYRGAYDSNEVFFYYSGQGVDWKYSTELFLPFMYVTTGWTNLEYVINSQDSRTYGLWFVKPFLGYFSLDEEFNFNDFYELIPYSSFNTFTFIAVGFKDFGYWFSGLSSIFIGFILKKVYFKYLNSFSPFDIATYIIFSLATIEMFFSNHYFMLSYPFTCLLIIGLYKLLFPKFVY